jgi:hypothetical protein
MGELILGHPEAMVDIKIVVLGLRDLNVTVHQINSLLQHSVGLLERGDMVLQSGVLCYHRVLDIVHQLSLSIGKRQVPIYHSLCEVIHPS